MLLLRTIAAGLRTLFRRAQAERDLDDELQHYLALAAEEHERAGLSPEQAARAARLEIGSVAATKQLVRDGSWESAGEALWRDLRFAGRRLRRQPGFTLVTTVALALALGATTTMLGVIAALDLRALPFAGAERLVTLQAVPPGSGTDCRACAVTSYATFDGWRASARSFERIAAVSPRLFAWLPDEEVDAVDALAVTPELFTLLGVRPALGRGIAEADVAPGAAPVVVLGDSLWRAGFGADPAVVGRRVTLEPQADGTVQSATVVGVMPPGFRFWNEAVWVAFARPPEAQRDARLLFVIGRLRHDVPLERANAELRLIASRAGNAAGEAPDAGGAPTARVVPLREAYVDTFAIGARRFLLFGIAALVLAIAAVNVAGLALGRVMARRGEFAVLLALGAPRRQLARQIVLECTAPALAAGVLGAVLGRWGAGVQARFEGLDSFGILVPPGLHLLGAGVLLALVLGVGVGLAAAALGLPAGHGGALRRRIASGAARERRGWIGDGFVVAQVACAFLLVTGAMLLGKELARLAQEEPGFDPRHLYLLNARAPESVRGDPAQQRAFALAARDRLERVPGVVGTALGPTDFGRGELRVEGPGGTVPAAVQPLGMSVDERYFPLFGTGVRQGRAFTAADHAGAPSVAVVNEAAAAQLWPGASAVGQRLFFATDSGGSWAQVVGVVANAKVVNTYLRSPPAPIVYRPFDQAPRSARVFVRLDPAADTARVTDALRATLREITGRPTNRMLEIGVLAESVTRELSSHRFLTRALGAFALFGLLLAAMGLSASVAAAVTRRTHEIGVRTALGATPRHVLALVTRRGALAAAAGLVAGGAAAVALTRVLQVLLVGTSPLDPAAFVAAAVCLGLVVTVASWLPARRATRIEPVDALRAE